jgi:hypothetical protein
MVTLSESGTHVVAYTIISRLRLRLSGHIDSESESGFFVFQTRSKKFENSVEHFRFQSVFFSYF